MSIKQKKNVLILGASSDIGVSVIDLFLKNNYFISAHSNTNADIIKKKFGKTQKIKIIKKNFLDIDDPNFSEFCKESLNENFSSYINLTGMLDSKFYDQILISDIYKHLHVNAIIPKFIKKHVVKKMLKMKYGRILNCSSIGVKFGGGKNTYAYSFSKHCSEFIPSQYKIWAKKNVLINNLRIGFTNTKIHKKSKSKNELEKRLNTIPLGRAATKCEIARYIFFLASEDNTYMTNETITVSGGEY